MGLLDDIEKRCDGSPTFFEWMYSVGPYRITLCKELGQEKKYVVSYGLNGWWVADFYTRSDTEFFCNKKCEELENEKNFCRG